MNLFYQQSRPTAQAGARLSAEAKVSYGFLKNLSTKARILTVVLCIANIFSQLLIIVAENQISYLNKMKAIL